MSHNRYIDTRGCCSEPVEFSQALVDGLAPGGGLYVPTDIPRWSVDDIVALAQLPYCQRAAAVYRSFCTDMPDEVIDRLMGEAYGEQFDTPDICPVVDLGNGMHVLELWHGPTSAFKDMALQCLPRFFSASAAQLREQGKLDHEFLILVATSGDTGSAALEGFADVPGVRIGVMYPQGGVSDIQYRQMATMRGSNTQVWAVRGNFDDCQSGAKAVFGDKTFAAELQERHGIALSSANSINWGRLLPQIVYYLSAYGQMVASGAVAAGELVDVCVPTGNFGNILAAWYARAMGAPIGRLLCASNQNCVLADFIKTGVYDIAEREFVLTPSPSMDILVSSNLERLLFELSGRDAQAVAGWMRDLAEKRRYAVDGQTLAALQRDFAADWVDSETCLKTIRRVLEQADYLLDPHTAVAYEVAERLRGDRPVVIASTAHWAKFGASVYRALHGLAVGAQLPAEVEALSGCELNALISAEAGGAAIPRGLAELDRREIRFKEVIDAGVGDIEAAARVFLERWV